MHLPIVLHSNPKATPPAPVIVNRVVTLVDLVRARRQYRHNQRSHMTAG
jgi:hypothetical protein